jgi:hypothetical protein
MVVRLGTAASAVGVLLAAAAAPVALLVPASAVCAQEGTPNKVDPYVAIVTQSGIPIRANNSIYFYPLTFTKPGDALVVDGESANWLRVMYPAGLRALAGGDEVQDIGGGKVRLTRASRLKAPNANGGAKGAFLGAVEGELPVGTELKVSDAVKDDSGKVTFYWVEAPASARGWISRDAVRKATDAEAQPVLAKMSPAVAAAPGGTPAPAGTPATTESPAAMKDGTPSVPPAPPATNPTTAATGSTPAAPTGEQPKTVNPPAVPTTTAPVPGTTASPTGTQPVTPPPATNPPAANPVATPPGMEIPATVPVGDKEPVKTTAAVSSGPMTMDGLKALYDRVRTQPAATAELDQAIAEFEKFKGTLSGTAHDTAVGKQLDAYISVMKMRKDIRDAQSANAAINRDTELMKSDVGKRVIELEKQRVYTLIGRLVRSTVYDGGRTPELYRVMSPEPGSARTLGYLLPDPKFDYSNKLDQVVGIIGELRPDESLRTNLIVPKRVDVVSLAPIVMSPDIPGVVVKKPADGQPAATPQKDKPATDPAKPATDLPKLPANTAPAVAPTPGGQPEKP